MIEVGDTLKNSREVSGVTLEEVSTDLDIPVILLLYANASDPISVTEDLNDIFPEIAPGKEAIILVLSLLYIIPFS